eukprot:scaffold487_cov344-Prasinococcus_capsulatus_cf.AAC.6
MPAGAPRWSLARTEYTHARRAADRCDDIGWSLAVRLPSTRTARAGRHGAQPSRSTPRQQRPRAVAARGSWGPSRIHARPLPSRIPGLQE